MKLTIEISCNDGLEMENNLNKAIGDFSEALKKKGFSEMELIAYNETIESEPIYRVFLQQNKCIESTKEYEPYFGWCDVEGCENEGANGGGCWRQSGYWTVCSKHSAEYREGKDQPKMKKSAIDREKRRGADGILT